MISHYTQAARIILAKCLRYDITQASHSTNCIYNIIGTVMHTYVGATGSVSPREAV